MFRSINIFTHLLTFTLLCQMSQTQGQDIPRYVDEHRQMDNVEYHIRTNQDTIAQLRKDGVKETDERDVGLYFFTNSAKKANTLAQVLEQQGLTDIEVSESDEVKNEWVIYALTGPLAMNSLALNDLTTRMCEIGLQNDCELDGWEVAVSGATELSELEREVEHHYDKALDLNHMGDYKQAEIEFTKAIELIKVPFPEMIYNRGMMRSRLGDREGAIQDFNRAIDLNPDYGEAYTNRGAEKDEMGDYSGAILDYDKAIQIDPNDTIAWFNRGNSCFNLGLVEDACADWRKAYELGDESAKERLDKYCK